MSAMSSKTIAFLGATGGCAGFCLSSALSAGFTCRALARNPTKLSEQLRENDISDKTLATDLTIIKGNAKDVAAVEDLLATTDDGVVDTIIFGIGAAPKWRLHPMPLTLDDTSVCETAMATVLAALTHLGPQSKKPLLVAVSTTGISLGPRDVPWLFLPLYKLFLHVPRVDKRAMEDLMRAQKALPEAARVVGAFVIARPSLLVDGKGHGVDAVRAGTEGKPVIGYTIARKDVGLWLFERLIKEQLKAEWVDNAVSLAT